MEEEARSRVVTVTLTPTEKEWLSSLARERGATINGTVRKLIRDAASKELPSHQHFEERSYAAAS